MKARVGCGYAYPGPIAWKAIILPLDQECLMKKSEICYHYVPRTMYKIYHQRVRYHDYSGLNTGISASQTGLDED
jgi:hypothetical protein